MCEEKLFLVLLLLFLFFSVSFTSLFISPSSAFLLPQVRSIVVVAVETFLAPLQIIVSYSMFRTGFILYIVPTLSEDKISGEHKPV